MREDDETPAGGTRDEAGARNSPWTKPSDRFQPLGSGAASSPSWHGCPPVVATPARPLGGLADDPEGTWRGCERRFLSARPPHPEERPDDASHDTFASGCANLPPGDLHSITNRCHRPIPFVHGAPQQANAVTAGHASPGPLTCASMWFRSPWAARWTRASPFLRLNRPKRSETPDDNREQCPVAVLIGMPGFVVLAADEVDGEISLLLETTANVAGCPKCGTVAKAKGRCTGTVRDLEAWEQLSATWAVCPPNAPPVRLGKEADEGSNRPVKRTHVA